MNNEHDFYFNYDRDEAFRRQWDQYVLVESDSEKYYDYIYIVITVAMTFFATLCAFSIIFHDNPILIFAIYRFILPLTLYVFGIMYAHNLCSLTRNRALGIHIENRLRSLSVEYRKYVPGWLTFSIRTKYNTSLVFSYGTVYLFFLLVPVCSIAFAQLFADAVPLTTAYTFGIPFFFWILFMVSVAHNIISILKYNRLIKRNLKRSGK